MSDRSLSYNLQHIILELRQVTVLASNAEKAGENHTKSITQALADQQNTLSSRMEQQYQDLNDRLDTLGRLVRGEGLQDGNPDETTNLPDDETTEPSNTETIRLLASHRIPCRQWCPCSCHEKRKANIAMPGFMQNLLGKMFVGYAGLPVLNSPCNFRGCRDRQDLAVTLEYWFPWWFVSKNLRVNVKSMGNSNLQFQLSTIRRVPDTAQSVTFALRGDIPGLQDLFAQGLASPKDVSDGRGYSLVRVSQSLTGEITLC